MEFTAGDTNFMQNLMHLTEETVNDVGAPLDYGIFGKGLIIGPAVLHLKARGEVLLSIFN